MKLAASFADDFTHPRAVREDVVVVVAEDYGELANMNGLSVAAVRRRIDLGNRPYVARAEGKGLAFAWVATELAHLGEVGRSVRLPDTDRFIWNLGAEPQDQHDSLYAALLDRIVLRENASRFWLDLSAPNQVPLGNLALTQFKLVGDVSFRSPVGAILQPSGSVEMALAAADLMGLRLASRHRTPGCDALPLERGFSAEARAADRMTPGVAVDGVTVTRVNAGAGPMRHSYVPGT